MLDRRADEIHAGIERNFPGAEKAARQPRRQLDHIGFAVMHHDVALDGAVGDAHGAGRAAHQIAHLGLDFRRQLAGQVAAILDEEGRIAFQIFVIAVGEARREAAPADDDGFRSKPAGRPDIAPPSPARWANGNAPA